MEVKKKQHFVSQFYLKAWSLNDGKVFTNFERIVKISTKKTAHSNYFYKVPQMSERDYDALIRTMKNKEGSVLTELYIQMIEFLRRIEVLTSSFPNGKNKIEMQKSLDNFKSNVVEEFFSSIEDTVAPFIKCILEKDYTKIDFDVYQVIVQYVILQMARTKKIKDEFRLSTLDLLESKGINFDTFHIFHSLKLAETLALVFIEKLYKIVIVTNNTGKNFITNDNPACNLNDKNVIDAKLFLPISPEMAIYVEPTNFDEEEAKKIKNSMLRDKKSFDYYLSFEGVSLEEVDYLNAKMWENQDTNVYAAEAKDIEFFLTKVED